MSETTYKIKTKEVEPKMYAILFLNRESKTQVIKIILAYTFEDAVATGRHWISKAFNITIAQAIKFEPSMYESVHAKSIIDFIVDGEERVITDTNALLKKIVDTEDADEAKKILKDGKSQLSAASVKYAEDQIKKKVSKKNL